MEKNETSNPEEVVVSEAPKAKAPKTDKVYVVFEEIEEDQFDGKTGKPIKGAKKPQKVTILPIETQRYLDYEAIKKRVKCLSHPSGKKAQDEVNAKLKELYGE